MSRFGANQSKTRSELNENQEVPLTLLRYSDPESELSFFVSDFPIRISTPYPKVPFVLLKGSFTYTKSPSQRISIRAWTLSDRLYIWKNDYDYDGGLGLSSVDNPPSPVEGSFSRSCKVNSEHS